MTTLDYKVLISDPIPQNVDALVPNGDRYMWSPQSTTLIFGERDAVLIDPPHTTDMAQDVSAWVRETGRQVKHIYITHGHGDHWFTAPVLAEEFGADVLATPGTIKLMRQELESRPTTWDVIFPGLLPEQTPVTAQTPADGQITLEGHTLKIVEVGHTDTDDTTVLHVPDIDLVVAGDAIYNGVHQYLAESANGGIQAWLRAVDIVESLAPKHVVCGHWNRELDDSAPRAIAETRKYLKDAEELLSQHDTAESFFNAVMSLYPERLNPTAIWMGATALYPEQG
jgi:glyoxylase-like metal-dependent hydrolase (beta-lactamase superfamily II)